MSSTTNSLGLEGQAKEWLKLRIADHARLMGDNQRILAERHEAARRDERRQERLAAMLSEQAFNLPPGSLNDEQPRAEDPVDIRIDSPTVTHNHPPPARAASPIPAVLLGATLALAIGGGIGAAMMLLKSRPPGAAAEDNDTKYKLRFGGSSP